MAMALAATIKRKILIIRLRLNISFGLVSELRLLLMLFMGKFIKPATKIQFFIERVKLKDKSSIDAHHAGSLFDDSIIPILKNFFKIIHYSNLLIHIFANY